MKRTGSIVFLSFLILASVTAGCSRENKQETTSKKNTAAQLQTEAPQKSMDKTTKPTASPEEL